MSTPACILTSTGITGLGFGVAYMRVMAMGMKSGLHADGMNT